MNSLENLKSLFQTHIIVEGKYDRFQWKKHQELKRLISETNFPGLETFEHKIWSLLHNIPERPTCSVCGKMTGFRSIHDGFRPVCSRRCSGLSEERRSKTRNTNQTRYGGHPMSSEAVQAKFRKIADEKYGGVWPGSFASAEHKNAIKEKYGVENVFQAEEIKQKIQQSFRDKYGVENPQQVPEIRNAIKKTKIERYGQDGWNPEQVKQTCLDRYGVENPQQSPEIRAKTKETHILRYGKDGFNPAETRKTMLEKYGVEYPMQSLQVQEQVKQTCLERYGVEHPMHDPAIFEKCVKRRFKLKDFILPSGRILKTQGYEHYVIDYLLQSKIHEDDIFTDRSSVPRIFYTWDNKRRAYYPDIFIKSKNTIIEVKSLYTFLIETEQTIAKQQATISEGFHHFIVIWDKTRNCIEQVL